MKKVLVKRVALCAALVVGAVSFSVHTYEQQSLELQQSYHAGNGSQGYPPPDSKTLVEKVLRRYGLLS